MLGSKDQTPGEDGLGDIGITKCVQPGRASVQKIHREDRHEHEDRTGHRVENELGRRVNTPFTTPDSDQEVHRNQHDLPEHIEQEQVQRYEDPNHAGLEQEHEDEVLLDPVGDRPGSQHGQRRQEGRQQDQKQADAVDAQLITDSERRNPGSVGHELKIRRRGIEVPEQMEGEDESQKRHPKGDDAGRLLLVSPEKKQQQCPHCRGEGHDREDFCVQQFLHHRSIHAITRTPPTRIQPA